MGRYATLNPSYRTAGAFSASIYLPATNGAATAEGRTAALSVNPTLFCSAGTAIATGPVFELRKVIACGFGWGWSGQYYLYRANIYQASIPCLAGTGSARGNPASIRTTIKAQRAIVSVANPAATIVFTGLVPGVLRSAQAYGRRCTPIMPDSVSTGKATASAFGRQANRVGTDVRVRCARYKLPAAGRACSVYRGFRVDGLAYPATASGVNAGILLKRVLDAFLALGSAHGESASLQLGFALPFEIANAIAAGWTANVIEGGAPWFPDEVLAQAVFVGTVPARVFARVNRYGVPILAPRLAADTVIRRVPRQTTAQPRSHGVVYSLGQ